MSQDNNFRNDTHAFLSTLWPDGLPGGKVVVWAKRHEVKNESGIVTQPGTKRTKFYENLPLAESDAIRLGNVGFNVYVGVASQDQDVAVELTRNPYTRGCNASAVAIPAVYVDIDIADGSHKGKNLPPDLDEAMKIIKSIGREPTMVVATGGGLHAWWCFNEPYIIKDAETRSFAQSLTRSFVHEMKEHAMAVGNYTIDSVGDQARVMRLPGTLNRKPGMQDRPCRIIHMSEARYEPEDIYEDWCTQKIKVKARDPKDYIADDVALTEDEFTLAMEAVSRLSSERASEYASWIKVGMALKAMSEGPMMKKLWHTFSEKGTGYDESACDEKWYSFAPNEMRGNGLSVLMALAREDSGEKQVRWLDMQTDEMPAWVLNYKVDEVRAAVEKRREALATTDSDGANQPQEPAAAPESSKQAENTKNEPVSSEKQAENGSESTARPVFSNVYVTKNRKKNTEEEGSVSEENGEKGPKKKEKEEIEYWKDPNIIASEIRMAMKGNPIRIDSGGGLAIVYDKASYNTPGYRPVSYITDYNDFFGYLSQNGMVRWSTGRRAVMGTHESADVVGKREFFAIMNMTGPAYKQIETLPHVPKIPGVLYICDDLPEFNAPEADQVSPLWELMSKFNVTGADTPALLAAMMTPLWGGPAGARPAFVLTADIAGGGTTGSGKTTTAELIAYLYGGHIGAGEEEAWEDVRKRLVQPGSLGYRVMLVDNVKHKVNRGGLEAGITASTIDGWGLYRGQVSRQNHMTWLFTANVSSMSRDLSDRSIIIRLGAPKTDQGFKQWAMEFIDKHREAILAEMASMLAGPSKWDASGKGGRWASFFEGVVSKVPNGHLVLGIAEERRVQADTDGTNARSYLKAIDDIISDAGIMHAVQKIVFVPEKTVLDRFIEMGIIERGSNGTVRSMIATASTNRAIRHIVPNKSCHGTQGFAVVGENRMDMMPTVMSNQGKFSYDEVVLVGGKTK